MLIEPEISSVSIVLLGSLNPKIFTPDWFARHGLLTGKEADAASVEIIHPQVTKFRTGSLTLQVETNRLLAEISEPPIKLKDLIVKTFKEFLPHTPINRMGINRQMHFSVGSTEVRDRIGFKLAPPDVWGEWTKDIMKSKGKYHGGMHQLVMRQGYVEGRPKGYIQATVTTSARIRNETGVYVQVNDHFETENPDDTQGCEEVIDYLDASFDDSLKRSEWIIDQIMALKDA